MSEALVLPMRETPEVKRLLELMDASGNQAQRQELISMVNYVDILTNQYNTIMKELTELKEKVGGITDKKNPLSVMMEHLTNVVADIGAKLKALKDSIIEFANNTFDTAKDKGLSAVGAVAGALHIHEGLEAISKGLGNAAAKVENLENFHHERMESKLLTEFEIPAELGSLSMDELKAVYAKLLDIGMNEDLSSAENAVLQDMVEEIEGMLPDSGEFTQANEAEIEAEQGAEMQ